MKNKDEELIKRAMADTARQNGTMAPFTSMSKVLEQLQHLSKYIAHLEQGLMNISTEIQAHRLSYQMMYQLLVEKEVVSEEELDVLYEKKVAKPMQEYVDDVNNTMKEAAEKFQEEQKEDSKKPIPTPKSEATGVDEIIKDTVDKVETLEEESNVILASERFKKTDKE